MMGQGGANRGVGGYPQAAVDPSGGASQSSASAPVVIVQEGTSVISGLEVQEQLVKAAKVFVDLLKPTYGPRGLDKMLYRTSGETAITNDGARIVSELLVKHPTAKEMVALGESQEAAIGDGVTGTVMLAGILLQEGGRLLRNKIHSSTIVEGYQKGLKAAVDELEKRSFSIKPNDEPALLNVARTAMCGKQAEGGGEFLAQLVVKAVMKVARESEGSLTSSSFDILMAKLGSGDISDTRLIEGVVLRKRLPISGMPTHLIEPKIGLVNSSLELSKSKYDLEIELTDADQLSRFLESEEKHLEKSSQAIIESGASALFVAGTVESSLLHRLKDAGILVVSDLDGGDLNNIARATGSTLVERGYDLVAADLGDAGEISVERREREGEWEEAIRIDGCPDPRIVTIEVGGGGGLSTEEVIRGMHDALKVTTMALRDGSLVVGGGSTYISAAKAVIEVAKQEEGRESIALEAFARALEEIPAILIENAGRNPLDGVLSLRAKLNDEESIGVLPSGEVGLIQDVFEPFESIRHSWDSATLTATGLLRVDQVISSKDSP